MSMKRLRRREFVKPSFSKPTAPKRRAKAKALLGVSLYLTFELAKPNRGSNANGVIGADVEALTASLARLVPTILSADCV